MKKILFFIMALLSIQTVYSQIGIYTETPHESTVLDIESASQNKGFLLPRLTTIQKESIYLPAKSLMVFDIDKNCLSQNVGTEKVPVWICLTQNQTRFFYMPAISVPTKTKGLAAEPLDLYGEYKKQFSTPYDKASNAPAIIPHYQKAEDLYYYVTYYDKSVLDIKSIGTDGKMVYEILKGADYDTYMNIVFVIK